MTGAGDLRDRIQFQKRGPDENGEATSQGEWENHISVRACLDYQRGSESAVSMRLEGRQPVVIIIRDSTAAREITPAFRAIKVGGLRDGEVFAITAVAPAQQRGFLNLMGISGVADG